MSDLRHEDVAILLRDALIQYINARGVNQGEVAEYVEERYSRQHFTDAEFQNKVDSVLKKVKLAQMLYQISDFIAVGILQGIEAIGDELEDGEQTGGQTGG